MKKNGVMDLITSDLYRYYGKASFLNFLKGMVLKAGFIYSFWLRLTYSFYRHPVFKWVLFPPAYLYLRHLSVKYGIIIPFDTCIGRGLFIGHFTGIVVHPDAVIGKNLNISQGVTIGQSSRGLRKGVPVIGDNVYIGPGAKVFGEIRVGDGAAIGANAVVTKDVPENAVVAGVPAHVISYNGSVGYVVNVQES